MSGGVVLRQTEGTNGQGGYVRDMIKVKFRHSSLERIIADRGEVQTWAKYVIRQNKEQKYPVFVDSGFISGINMVSNRFLGDF